jgi:hypothetical protein
MAKPREGYHDFFAQIPIPLWHALQADAERNMRNATTQFIWILMEHYPDAMQNESEALAAKKRGKNK